jgi:cyclophilin family peptidyl-prolyl cis-trans isomerase
MRQSIRGVWDLLHKRNTNRRDTLRARPTVRPSLEALEDRLTPTTNTILASGVISGFVLAGEGGSGLPGVGVSLTGSTTTGRTVNVAAVTDGAGGYLFNNLLPGTYSLSRGANPSGFVGGNVTQSNVTLSQGQVVTGDNLTVGGLTAPRVSLAFFVSGAIPPQLPLPTPGVAVAQGFSLDNAANPLTPVSVAVGSTNFVDLSANFFDPDTTDTTVTFNTSQGSFNVELFDKDAPQTVTNFLDYIMSGDYTNDLFHRMSNLGQTTAMNPPITPYQILQAGGFTVGTDTATPPNVTGITALSTFQPIQNEFSNAHQNAAGTLAMARTSDPNSATSQFFFNLTDNSSALNSSNGGGFAVFGQVTDATGMTALQNFTTHYTATDISTATTNSALVTTPLLNGFTPTSTPTLGATINDLAVINSITVPNAPTGHLTYKIVGNSNPNAVQVVLGQNVANSTFSANQLQLHAVGAGTSIITIQVQDNRGEAVNVQFAISAS